MQTAEIEALLAPVSADDSCGVDLEYGDAAFTAFDHATQGKPEQQIGSTIIPAEEPDWKSVARQGIALLGRTKDLRVAVHLTKALLHTDGLKGLADGLTLLRRFVETYWEGLHPRLDPADDNDPTMRINILATLATPDLLATLRATPLITSRTVGQFSYRDVETASSADGGNGAGLSMASIEAAGMDCDLGQLQERASAAVTAGAELKQLEALLTQLIGGAAAPAFGNLAALLQKISVFLRSALARRAPSEASAEEVVGGAAGSGGALPAAGSPSGEIRTREDVVRALERISAYYAKHEPSSPIPLLVERCKRLVTMGFLDIIRELAPDGVRQIETLSGEKQG
jgi:type VI secretion system protein ImpA